jgi:hypothetical protein
METIELDYEGIEQLPLKTFTERAYLDYSMYVILDRAWVMCLASFIRMATLPVMKPWCILRNPSLVVTR